eukprot:1139598-Prymnesium_polylepis.1
MVGDAYGCANSHRSHWVGLFFAGVPGTLTTYLLMPTYLSQGGSPTIARNARFEACGVVLRPSLFTYSYDPSLASPWLCAQI